MKPFRIFIFFLAVLGLLLLISYLFPRQGIRIGGELKLTFPSVSELNHQDTSSAELNVEQLLAGSGVTEDPESEPAVELFPGITTEEERIAAEEERVSGEEESVAGEEESVAGEEGKNPAEQRRVAAEALTPTPTVIPANTDSLKKYVYRIRFPDGGVSQLHSYFRNLDRMTVGGDGPTRILHFGDSQIENDRMTSLIRYRMQRLFGGTGVGLVQAIPLYSGSLAYQQEESGNWLRYTYFGNRDSTLAHNSYGIMGAFASVPIPEKDRWPTLYYRFNRSRRSGRVQRIRLFMHSYVDDASLAFQINGYFTDTLRGLPDGFSVAEFSHFAEIEEVKISFHLPEGGRIYGISFESEEGVQVDNIAMRGGSGLIFTSMNRSTQEEMLNVLSPGLILLQYGGNVVPYMSAGYYRRAFRRQLRFFKELCPGVPLIVIGPSDMSVRENGKFNTYPGLKGIRDALHEAAMESGCGFWDLYEAMGGENSMASFVHSDPPLASTDYVHFTNLGVNLVAELFYNALMLEYTEYESQKSVR